MDASTGDICVAGWVQGSGTYTFPTTNGYQTTEHGTEDAFVTEFNPANTGTAQLVYSTYLNGTSGNSGESGDSLAVYDSNIYWASTTTSTVFPTTAGAYQTTLKGTNGFVAEINPSTSGTASLVYSTYLGGSGSDSPLGIAVDSSGDAYLTGTTTSSNFPTTAGVYQTAYNTGGTNAFVTELNPSGTGLVYSTFMSGSTLATGGTSLGAGTCIAVDGAGDAYMGGYTGASNFPTTPGACQTTLASGRDPRTLSCSNSTPAVRACCTRRTWVARRRRRPAAIV